MAKRLDIMRAESTTTSVTRDTVGITPFIALISDLFKMHEALIGFREP